MNIIAIQGELQICVGCGLETRFLFSGNAGKGPAQGEASSAAYVELEGSSFCFFLEGQPGGVFRNGGEGSGGERS